MRNWVSGFKVHADRKEHHWRKGERAKPRSMEEPGLSPRKLCLELNMHLWKQKQKTRSPKQAGIGKNKLCQTQYCRLCARGHEKTMEGVKQGNDIKDLEIGGRATSYEAAKTKVTESDKLPLTTT